MFIDQQYFSKSNQGKITITQKAKPSPKEVNKLLQQQ